MKKLCNQKNYVGNSFIKLLLRYTFLVMLFSLSDPIYLNSFDIDIESSIGLMMRTIQRPIISDLFVMMGKFLRGMQKRPGGTGDPEKHVRRINGFVG